MKSSKLKFRNQICNLNFRNANFLSNGFDKSAQVFVLVITLQTKAYIGCWLNDVIGEFRYLSQGKRRGTIDDLCNKIFRFHKLFLSHFVPANTNDPFRSMDIAINMSYTTGKLTQANYVRIKPFCFASKCIRFPKKTAVMLVYVAAISIYRLISSTTASNLSSRRSRKWIASWFSLKHE